MSNRTGFSTFWLVSAAILSLAATSYAQLAPTTAGPLFGSDDWNTATLNPSPIIPVGGGTAVPQCPWINTGLAQAGFVASNGWNFTWAPSAAFVQPDLTINQYFAWVVNEPKVIQPNGGTNWQSKPNPPFQNRDAGGAVFGLTYNPQAGDPTNVFFIQAYIESFNGGQIATNLDNPTAGSPFYNVGGAAGLGTTNNANASWFLDMPYDSEANTNIPNRGPGEESLTNSVVQFQVVLAVDVMSGTTNNVTLYGGDWWGYQYSNTDIPEPSTVVLAASGLGALALVRTIRRRRRRT
jgi:hypothetical protein